MSMTLTHGPRTTSAAPARRSVLAELVRFVGIGLLTWGVCTVIYLALRTVLPSVPANLVSALLRIALGTELNGKLTFRRAPTRCAPAPRTWLRRWCQYSPAPHCSPRSPRWLPARAPLVEAAVFAVLGAMTGLVRFAVLRWWVFTPRR